MQKGDFVEFDGLLAVVVGIESEDNVREEHIAIWFGDPQGQRRSEGGTGSLIPEVWTVPIELCQPAQPPAYFH
jgi:hypothetical protein